MCHSERSEGSPAFGQRFSPALAAQSQVSPLATGTPSATGFQSDRKLKDFPESVVSLLSVAVLKKVDLNREDAKSAKKKTK